MPKAKGEHYVDNKKFFSEMVKYKNACEKAESSDHTLLV